MSPNTVKGNVDFKIQDNNSNGIQKINFLESKNVHNKLRLTIKKLSFHNSNQLNGYTDLSVQLVEYTSDYVLREITNPLNFTIDSKNENEELDIEIPFFIDNIFSKDFKILLKITNYFKNKEENNSKTYTLLINVSEGKVNTLAQGLRLFKFDDFGRNTLLYNNVINKINENLDVKKYSLAYLNKLLLNVLDNLEEYMSFNDIEKGANFLLLSFPKYEYPIVINDKLKVDNSQFYNKPKLENFSQLQQVPLQRLNNNSNTNNNNNNGNLTEFIKIGKVFNQLRFNDPLQYDNIRNPIEEKKQMILRKKPYKNNSKKPINELEPGYLTKLILERLVDATKYNYNSETTDSSIDNNNQSINLFDDIISTTVNKYDMSDLNWLSIYTFQDLHQVLQENNKEHNSFRSKLIWGFRKYILNKLDSDGSGMLTILSNINWNDLILLPDTFLLRRARDLDIFYKNIEPIFEGYDFKKVSVEILLQLLRFKTSYIQDSIFQDCIYYNEENTEEMRSCIHSQLQQFLHENLTVKVIENLKLKDFQLYLLHVVEGICWDYKNVEYFAIEFDDEDQEEEEDDDDAQELEEEQTINGNKFTVPKSITLSDPSIIKVLSPLSNFLLSKGLDMFVEIGNYLYWYLKVQLLYSNKIQELIDSYEFELTGDEKTILSLQKEFISKIDSVNQTMKTYVIGSIKNMSKQEYLEYLINKDLNSFIKIENQKNNFLRLPILPNYKIIKINSNNCKMFKSSLQPIKLSFILEELSSNTIREYSVIYKNGDDLKQDQLISNIIKIMDSLLLEENVNLNIKTYDILPMGLNMGMIEFIESDTVSNILSNDSSIKNFLRKKQEKVDPSGSEITNVFIKSTAAYSVITYLLGIGDRHLENLLITPKGEFFHADFGYILGNDPKLFPPLMKLPPQIVEGFGGTKDNNAKYDEFRGYCFVCFLILRRNSSLLIDLFKFIDLNSIPIAMRTATKGKSNALEITNNTNNVDQNNNTNNNNLNIVKNDYNKFIEKFQLEMSEDDAILYLQNLINTSINALLPLVIDHLHNLAQYWRN
ncbi:hypothetical protein HANVADRAFT_52535 [Hanseniaspora valbyensis NRRL Y-1626]|uniref:PI3K/PI4K catalytic domain-containing protein n=1 Tax=Hanseniaspora valbyensis NRRL Y-1626 TaxID=766949 RepID=A0A1B7TER8_9ASCO|nr:hypothetical protein HANVADRAFT_52535 [Hanseniaspora valbyensis NRRL Y-1626]